MDVLDIFFPKSCSICGKKEEYLCSRCKKLFKRNLPECYICRKLSSNYKTHLECKKRSSLDHVFVSWKYDSLSSSLLKNYKYKNIFTISDVLSDFLVESFLNSQFKDIVKDSLIINVPISFVRLRDRGFNQTEDIAIALSKKLNIPYSNNFIMRRVEFGHQSLRDKDERRYASEDEFHIKNHMDMKNFKSITIVDDVLTTGATLEAITGILKKEYGSQVMINAICMFRGRAYYSTI
jgi:ComF family protein